MAKSGQHFLKNKNILRRIADIVKPEPGEIIIEIGAGHGELTEELGKKNYDSKIIAIEKDYKLFKMLERKFLGNKNSAVIHGDILKILPRLIRKLGSINQNYKLTGNLPFYITGRLLRMIGELEIKPKLCVFTIQKEVAKRITSRPPKTNKLSASIQYWAEPKIIITISRKYFSPIPEVDSAVIKMELKKHKKDQKEKIRYYRIINILFRQPRKTILNNLSVSFLEKDKNEINKKLLELHIDPSSRSQNLAIEQIEQISANF